MWHCLYVCALPFNSATECPPLLVKMSKDIERLPDIMADDPTVAQEADACTVADCLESQQVVQQVCKTGRVIGNLGTLCNHRSGR